MCNLLLLDKTACQSILNLNLILMGKTSKTRTVQKLRQPIPKVMKSNIEDKMSDDTETEDFSPPILTDLDVMAVSKNLICRSFLIAFFL